jgi:hypothetical protein
LDDYILHNIVPTWRFINSNGGHFELVNSPSPHTYLVRVKDGTADGSGQSLATGDEMILTLQTDVIPIRPDWANNPQHVYEQEIRDKRLTAIGHVEIKARAGAQSKLLYRYAGDWMCYFGKVAKDDNAGWNCEETDNRYVGLAALYRYARDERARTVPANSQQVTNATATNAVSPTEQRHQDRPRGDSTKLNALFDLFTGLHDLRFGDAPQPGMVVTFKGSQWDETQIFTIPNATVTFAGYKASTIHCAFPRGKLGRLSLRFPPEAARPLRMTLLSRFGEPPNPNGPFIDWTLDADGRYKMRFQSYPECSLDIEDATAARVTR